MAAKNRKMKKNKNNDIPTHSIMSRHLQQNADNPAPGCTNQKAGNEESTRHTQPVRPTCQEEVAQGEDCQRQDLIGAWEGGSRRRLYRHT